MSDEIRCPVEDCEHPPFKTIQAQQSHIRSKHPELASKPDESNKVPIVEDDFANLLKKFKVNATLATNIAENVSHTGGSKVFEEPELLLKRLSLWSSDIPPARRKNIIEQWFAERGVEIPLEIQQKAGMTTDQIQETEKKTKEETEVRYVYDTESQKVRMAKEGERGGTLSQAKELKKMAEDDEKVGQESPFIMDTTGRWGLNPKAKITGIEYMAFQNIQKAQAKGEEIDPLTAMARAAEQMKLMKETFGGGGSSLPGWLSDPVAFANAVKTITGNSGGDSAAREAMAAMQRTIEELKEDRWQTQFEAQQKQIADVTMVLNKTLEAIGEMKKERVGRTEMDIISNIASEGISLAKTELPGFRKDLKEAIGSVVAPMPKTTEQREDRKKKFKEAIDTDGEIEDIGRQLFFSQR